MNKCLHISANQFPSLDKVNFTKSIWKELAKGFDEYHIVGRSHSNKFEDFREENIYLHLVPKLGNRERSFLISSFYIFILIKKFKITHLLAQDALLGGFTGIFASRYYRIPIMIEIHGDIYFKYFIKKGIKNFILSEISKFAFKRANKVRSLSDSMTKVLRENNIYKNVVVIPNRVNLNLFSNNKKDYSLHNPIRLTSIGRFVEQKGYDIAIEVIKKLSRNVNIELYLIGGGRLFNKLNNLIGSYNNNIHLIDWIPQNELKILLENTDIYIQPSKPYLGEAMPRTILEAMAMRLPIISTNIAAIPGVLNDGVNAILINPNDSDELANAIIRLAQDQDLRSKIGNQAYLDASEKYEWNQTFKNYRHEIISM